MIWVCCVVNIGDVYVVLLLMLTDMPLLLFMLMCMC